ncbi:hypothetical protein GGI07_004665 [Coemansia sp. Benny D115]|nr:hypothetical protein GGI07_004665 [Coemansia sp. Benny D115]
MASSSISRFDTEKPLKATQPSQVILSWKNLEYRVASNFNKNGTPVTILSKVSGEICAGETIALIGSSGAGKTTLLNALSGRIVGGELTGSIQFCGAKRHPGSFKRLTAYVQQDDLMHPLLTVRETLTYASKLRLPNTHYSPQQKDDRVNTVIRQLRLENARNTRIGDASTRGVSGGERKRVSIGTELLTDPKLLFLDEPTSGLDSNSSELVVELVKKISVEQNSAAIMTIHQPNARIFNIFDKVILLSQGRLVYFGPTSSAIDYFASIGFQCPVHENPADYFVDLMTLDYRSDEALAASKAQVAVLVEKFEKYSMRKHADKAASHCIKQDGLYDIDIQATSTLTEEVDLTPNSWISEYFALSRRDWTNILRNRYYTICQVLQPLAMGLYIGSMFFNLRHDSLSISNRLGALYIIVVQATFPIFMPQIALLVSDLHVAAREQSSGSYRLSTYFASKVGVYLPIALVCNTLFYIVVYAISRLDMTPQKFFLGLMVFYCQNTVTVGFMFVFAAAIKSIAVIYVMSTAAITVQMLYSGLFVNFHSVPGVLEWVRWINPIYYSFAALAQNEMSGMRFTCLPNERCFSAGEQVLGTYELDRFNILQNSLLLLLVGLGYYICGYVLLRLKATPKFKWI